MGLYCRSDADEVNLWGSEGFDFPTVQARDSYIFRTGQIPAGRRRHTTVVVYFYKLICVSHVYFGKASFKKSHRRWAL